MEEGARTFLPAAGLRLEGGRDAMPHTHICVFPRVLPLPQLERFSLPRVSLLLLLLGISLPRSEEWWMRPSMGGDARDDDDDHGDGDDDECAAPSPRSRGRRLRRLRRINTAEKRGTPICQASSPWSSSTSSSSCEGGEKEESAHVYIYYYTHCMFSPLLHICRIP